jgi:hypothetical protein
MGIVKILKTEPIKPLMEAQTGLVFQERLISASLYYFRYRRL